MVRGDAGQRAGAVCPLGRSAEHVTAGECLFFPAFCSPGGGNNQRCSQSRHGGAVLQKGMVIWS